MVYCIKRLILYRKHYAEYLALCTEKNIAPKATQPDGWKHEDGCVTILSVTITESTPSNSNLKQSAISKFTVVKAPPVTKAGIVQHYLEVMVDLNLVSTRNSQLGNSQLKM